jgi:uncharacterized protein
MNWSRTQPEPAWTGPETEPEETTGLTRRQLIASGAISALGALSIESFAETAQIVVTHHQMLIKHLPQPFTAVQITDVHRSQFVPERFVERVVDTVNAIAPDVVLLTGDFVTRTTGYVESCVGQLSRLRAPLGKYAVLGNHDYWCEGGNGGPYITDALEEAHIGVLTNRNVVLSNGLRLVGLDDVRAGLPNLPLSFGGVRTDEPVLCMTHNPTAFSALRRFDVNTIAGHTHGGQIFLPLVAGVVVRSPYIKGWYSDSQHPGRMFVCRGLGTIHVPMRMASRPELAVFHCYPG